MVFADSKIVHYLHKKAQRLKEEKWFCQLSGSGKDSHRPGFALQRFPERHMLGRLVIYVVGLQYRAICKRKTEHRKPFLFSGFTSKSHCCREIRRPSQPCALQSYNKFDESFHSIHVVCQQTFFKQLLYDKHYGRHQKHNVNQERHICP